VVRDVVVVVAVINGDAVGVGASSSSSNGVRWENGLLLDVMSNTDGDVGDGVNGVVGVDDADVGVVVVVDFVDVDVNASIEGWLEERTREEDLDLDKLAIRERGAGMVVAVFAGEFMT
jgi:hypothetical protein